MAVVAQNWPLDEFDNPMALVSFSVEEKIGLPEYSNITIGPITLHRFAPDSPEDRKKALKSIAAELEQILAEEREIVYEALRKSKGLK